MANVLQLKSVRDTTLWKQLETGFSGSPQEALASEFASDVAVLCDKASERIKAAPYYHPQFTLHDETHMLRVCELMSRVLGEALASLNPIELALLILGAYFHDQGMIPDATEWDTIQKSPDFLLSAQRWEMEHPAIHELRQHIADPRFSDNEKDRLQDKLREVMDAHRTEFLRRTHADRSADIVNRLVGTHERLLIGSTSIAPALARLCSSHAWSADRLTDDDGLYVDQSFGMHTVNMRFLAIVLRLADILDFDNDRTPLVLLNAIHFSSDVSLREWSKHRSVEGWDISAKRIRFTMQCEHPAYQKAAYEFMDTIDQELIQAHRTEQAFPRTTPQHYRLALPLTVERDRIEPQHNSYHYADLEFSLSRDEIVKLLMTNQLYRSHALFVRELLQNALDALRHRQALYGKNQPSWGCGHIAMEHATDSDGYQVVRCVDNGVGMDEDIIRRFLTKAGRSYYRSPEFEAQRMRFRENGVDFDPCAQFGIGFMSCFMFGDRITITTRRDYGPGQDYGAPLKVEIHGLSGLLIVRPGAKDQSVGTTVEITGPRKPPFVDGFTDPVRLCGIVHKYALATEFPIYAKTSIDEIAREIRIPPGIASRATPLELAGITAMKVIEQPFSTIDRRLSGSVRVGVLVDHNGNPVIRNAEAQWSVQDKENRQGKELVLLSHRTGVTTSLSKLHRDSTTCLDGVLVCGRGGRDKEDRMLAAHSNRLRLGDPFLVDIRGDIKPALTPARTPPDVFSLPGQFVSWRRIQDLLTVAHARAWEQLLSTWSIADDPMTFWMLALFHHIPLSAMNAELLWSKLIIPCVTEHGTVLWKGLPEVGPLLPKVTTDANGQKTYLLQADDGSTVMVPNEIQDWGEPQRDLGDRQLHSAVVRFAHMETKDTRTQLALRPPSLPAQLSSDLYLHGEFGRRWAIPFSTEIGECLAIESPWDFANSAHPLVKFVKSLEATDSQNHDNMQHFCVSLVWILTCPEFLMEAVSGPIADGRKFRYLGRMYKSIDWRRYDPAYRPPYKVWTTAAGLSSICQEHLLKWADLPLTPHPLELEE